MPPRNCITVEIIQRLRQGQPDGAGRLGIDERRGDPVQLPARSSRRGRDQHSTAGIIEANIENLHERGMFQQERAPGEFDQRSGIDHGTGLDMELDLHL